MNTTGNSVKRKNDVNNLERRSVSCTAKHHCKRNEKQNILKRNIILSFICFALTMTFLLSLNSINVNAKTNKSNCYKYFTVVEVKIGDTLTSIASEYYDENYYNNLNEFMKEIKYSNQIANCNNLKEGQTLVIPYYSPEYHF